MKKYVKSSLITFLLLASPALAGAGYTDQQLAKCEETAYVNQQEDEYKFECAAWLSNRNNDKLAIQYIEELSDKKHFLSTLYLAGLYSNYSDTWNTSKYDAKKYIIYSDRAINIYEHNKKEINQKYGSFLIASEYATRGLLSRNGMGGIKANRNQAYLWYRKALDHIPDERVAERSNIKTSICLMFYADGGRDMDKDKALPWCKQAADEGDADAKQALESMLKK